MGFDGSAVLAGVAPGTLEIFSVNMKSWLPDAGTPSLLYRMTSDGTSTSEFHSRCDGKGPTVVLIRSDNGFVFGGYADKPWHSEGKYIACDKSFIFTVCNPHGIPPTRYLVNSPAHALYGDASCGPTFGCDAITVGMGGYLTDGCCTPFFDYTDTTGKGAATFTGAAHPGPFTPAEVEVWRV